MDGAQVQFWDLGGAEDLHGLWAGYYAESHVVMFVVDSMDTVRLERSLQVLSKSRTDGTWGIWRCCRFGAA